MLRDIKSMDALEVAQNNYREYSEYVIRTRAYPGLIDGMKSGARRCVYATHKFLPRKKVKSTNAIGEIVRFHCHPDSIYGILVGLASEYDCPFPLYDIQGNFGGLGSPAAAARYTELMLSDLAIKMYGSFSDYVDMEKGEMELDEPTYLASLIPYCFLAGTYGIPVGMSTVNIPPMNPVDIVKYYIKILSTRDIDTIPNTLIRPNIGNVNVTTSEKDWRELLRTGRGSVTYQPIINIMSDGRSVEIIGLPPNKNFTHIQKILEEEILRDQIDLRDETTTVERYVIEIPPYRRVNAKDIRKKLINKLTSNASYRFTFAHDSKAVNCGFHTAVKYNLEYTIKCCERKLDSEIKSLKYNLRVLEIIEEMKSEKDIVKLSDMTYNQAITYISKKYKCELEQAKSVMLKSMSYLTKEHNKEIKDIRSKISKLETNSDDIYNYLLSIYKTLLKDVEKFMENRPITKFVKK